MVSSESIQTLTLENPPTDYHSDAQNLLYLTTVDRAIVSIYRLLNDISFTVHLQTSMVVQNSDISRDK